MSSEPSVPSETPIALARPRRRWPLLWMLPIAAVGLSAWLLLSAVDQRGFSIEVHFEQGHGIKPGNALRYRGIDVGSVDAVTLGEDLESVRVRVRVKSDARALTRAQSRFWIVRPQLDLSGAAGLETVIGAKYLNVLPGEGDFITRFTGLEQPPRAEVLEPGGLQIVLVTPSKGSLRAGAPVSYRQVIIGTISVVDLARDASAVEVRVYVKPDYVPLIRNNVRFWKSGGARFSAGLTGLTVAVDSVQSLILGGVELAIPPTPGERVSEGHIFPLYDEPEPQWLRWLPSLPLLEAGDEDEKAKPRMQAAILSWQYENLLYMTRERQRRGWLLPVQGGLLGPADLLSAPDEALAGSSRLALADTLRPLDLEPLRYGDRLAVLTMSHPYEPWSKLRPIAVPEDSMVVADTGEPARFVAASRYQAGDDSGWTLDPNLAFDPGWHGGAVVATSDGAVIGILLVTDDETRMAKLDEMPHNIPSSEEGQR